MSHAGVALLRALLDGTGLPKALASNRLVASMPTTPRTLDEIATELAAAPPALRKRLRYNPSIGKTTLVPLLTVLLPRLSSPGARRRPQMGCWTGWSYPAPSGGANLLDR